jgi:proteic killer suppression protein
MIKSYRGKFAEPIHSERKIPKGFPADVVKVARRKLVMLNAALKLDDLKRPPGNMLEALKGNLKGKHSIRVNDKWRIVFKWTEEGPEDVEIDDYHD